MASDNEFNVALDHVLAAPTFRRSPVLTRLLRYLVAESAVGRGSQVKSYAVAVDGLGRPEDFDSHSDSYARVHVSRLRRALDSFYDGPGRELAMRFQIPHGSYAVELVSNTPYAPAILSLPLSTWARCTSHLKIWLQSYARRLVIGLGAVLIILGAGLVLLRWLQTDGEWSRNDFPSVAIVASEARDSQFVETAEQSQFILEVVGAFNLMEGINVVDRIDDHTDYVVELGLRRSSGGTGADVTLINHAQDRIVWSRKWLASETVGLNRFDDHALASAIAFELSQGTGPIHSDRTRLAGPPETPHGCWLAFAHLWQQQLLVTNDELDRCSRRWLSAAPNDPLAAKVRGWVLIDSVLADPQSPNRSTNLDEADALAHRNLRLNPDQLSATLLALHVYSFTGSDDEFQRVADHLLRRYGTLPDISGAVGLHMLMRGDLRGKVLVQEALKSHFNPPPRFLLGLFIAAVLEDDMRAARLALAAIPSSGRDAQYALLSAAVAAREGRIGIARAALSRAAQAQRAHGRNIDAILRSGIFPEPVKQRLQVWLEAASDR